MRDKSGYMTEKSRHTHTDILYIFKYNAHILTNKYLNRFIICVCVI